MSQHNVVERERAGGRRSGKRAPGDKRRLPVCTCRGGTCKLAGRSATTLDAAMVYAYDGEAGGIIAAPRRGGEPRLVAPTRAPALALASHDGALYAIIGDPRRAPREIWRVAPETSSVTVLGHFTAEVGPGGYLRSGLAVGRTALYIYSSKRLLSVPRS